MTVSYNSLWHRDGRICHILRREYVQTEEDMNEKCIMQGGVVFEMEACGKMVLVCEKEAVSGKRMYVLGQRGQRQEKRVFK